MNARFCKQLSLKSDRQTVAAGDPCGWQDGDASAVVKDVRVTQGHVVASGGGSTTICKGARGWSLDVSSSANSLPGRQWPAPSCSCAGGTATTYEYPWSDDVQLVQLDAALELDEIQGDILAGFKKDYELSALCASR
jgi:hypothetical protein